MPLKIYSIYDDPPWLPLCLPFGGKGVRIPYEEFNTGRRHICCVGGLEIEGYNWTSLTKTREKKERKKKEKKKRKFTREREKELLEEKRREEGGFRSQVRRKAATEVGSYAQASEREREREREPQERETLREKESRRAPPRFERNSERVSPSSFLNGKTRNQKKYK